MYLTTMAQKPHVVAKGKNFVIKEFNAIITQEYRANKAVFNEFYFKKCICAAIIYRTVDNYLEINKDSAKKQTGFWYKAGGYKLDIVPYTIAKILYSIPNGYTLNWDYIWNHQKVSPAFMREIELVTKMTNDLDCEINAVKNRVRCLKCGSFMTRNPTLNSRVRKKSSPVRGTWIEIAWLSRSAQ